MLALPLDFARDDEAHLFVEGEAVDDGPVAGDVVEEPARAVVHRHTAVTVPGKGSLYYRVSHDTAHLENLAKTQILYKHKLDA